MCYHVIPFARTDDEFVDDCRIFGNVLHRLRVPYRVSQATKLCGEGITIESIDQLGKAVDWVKEYVTRVH